MTTEGDGLPAVIVQNRETTEQTVRELRTAIVAALGDRTEAVIGDHTTFILTGSAGRGEMTEGSDIDGHVVRVGDRSNRHHDALLLCATAAALDEQGLPPLDRDGEFLSMKEGETLVSCLGSAEDDYSNALTTRLLFLLEGRPLVGERGYERLSRLVQHAYRSTADGHADDFLPFFLVNDIIRYWRTVLLNHEDRLRQKKVELEAEGLQGRSLDEELLAHRKYRSQKLRFPRCITCFSALAHILAIAPSDRHSVSEADEQRMFDLTPLERMQHIAEIQPASEARIARMVDLYARYLRRSTGAKGELIERLRDDEAFAQTTSSEGLELTAEMFRLIQELGDGSRLHRQMLI